MRYVVTVQKFALGLSFALAAQSCSLKSNGQDTRLSIPVPNTESARSARALSLGQSQSAYLTTEANLETAPTSLEEFDCFGVNVTGPGIQPDPRMQCSGSGDPLAIHGGLITSHEGIIDVTVPSGPGRKIQVFGLRSTVGCPSIGSVLDATGGRKVDGLGPVYLLGETTKDVFSDTTVEIRIGYDSSNKKRLFNGCEDNSSSGAKHLWNVYNTSTAEIRATQKVGDTLYIGGTFNYVGPATMNGALFDKSTLKLVDSDGAAKINGLVNCATPDGNGGFYVGGSFTSVDTNTSQTYLAHILPTGQLNPAFTIVPNGEVRACLRVGNELYIGGSFSIVGGQARGKLARFDISGGVATLSSWAPSLNGAVNALIADSSLLYVGGEFTSANDGGGAQARGALATFDRTTLALDAFHVDLTSGAAFAKTLLLDPSGSGNLYVGGNFGYAGGLSRNNAALISSGGTVLSWNPNPNSSVYSLAGDGSWIYLSGDFTTVDSISRMRIAKVNPTTGSVDSGWNPSPTNSGGISVQTLAVNGSVLYVGGLFNMIGGLDVLNFAALNTSSGAAIAGPDFAASGEVKVISMDSSRTFIGGSFQSIGGAPRMNLAALDLTTGAATSWAPNPDTGVKALAADGSSALYVGGAFGVIGGQAIPKLAKVDLTTGSVVAGWNPVLSSGNISVLKVGPSAVYAGGTSFMINGGGGTMYAAFNKTTAATTAGHLTLNTGSQVLALELSGSHIYIGGSFTHSSKNNLIRLDLTGGIDASWTLDPDGVVNSLALAANNNLFIGGNFANIGGLAIPRLAAYRVTDAAMASTWIPNPDTYIISIATVGSTVYFGGSFVSLTAASPPARYGAAAASTDVSGSAQILPWLPNAWGSVYSIFADSTSVFLGGSFEQVNYVSAPNSKFAPKIASFDPITGGLN